MSLPKGPTTTGYECTKCGTTWATPNPGHCFKCDTGEYARAISQLVDEVVWMCQRSVSLYGNEETPPFWGEDKRKAFETLDLGCWLISCKIGDYYGEGCSPYDVFEALELWEVKSEEDREALVRRFLSGWEGE